MFAQSRKTGFSMNQPTQSPSLFGNKPSTFGQQQNNQSSLFGNKPQTGGSMFGNQPRTQTGTTFGNQPQTQTGGTMFGNRPQTQTGGSMFGNQPRAQTGTMFGNQTQQGSLFGGQRQYSANHGTHGTGTSSMFQPPQQGNMNMQNQNQNRFLQRQTNYFQKPNLKMDGNMVNNNLYRSDGWKKVKNEGELDFKYNFLLRKNPELILELNEMNIYNSKKFSEMGQEQRFQQMVKAIDDLVNQKSKEIKNVLQTIKNVDNKLENSIYKKTKTILLKFEKLNLVLKDFRLKLKKLQDEFLDLRKILENQQRQVNKLKKDYQMNYTIPSKMSLKINKILQEKIKQLKSIIFDLLEIYKSFNENTNVNDSEYQMEENLESLRELSLFINGLLSDADEIGHVIINLKKNRLGSNPELEEEGKYNKNMDIYDLFENKMEMVKNKLENFN